MHHYLSQLVNDKSKFVIFCETILILLIMSQHGRDFEKQGFTYMDGVPVKISEQYKPPKKYNLPVGFMQKLPTETITEQYDFQLEKSVLEKISEWRKIRTAAIEDRRQRIEAEDKAIQEQAEKLKELSIGSPTHAVNATEDHNIKEPLNNSSKSDALDNVTQENSKLPVAPNSEITEYYKETDDNSQNAKVTIHGQMLPTQSNQYATPTNILTPTPYGSFLSQKKDMVPSPFNLSDFEADTSSPFDNMELKTINDMEELAYVLQPMSNSPKVKEMPISNNLPQFTYYNPNVAIHPTHPSNAQVSTSHTSIQPVSGEILSKTMPQINGITSYSLYGTVPRSQTQAVNHVKNAEMHNSPYGAFEGINYHYPIGSMQNSALLRSSAHDYYSGHPWDPKQVESTASSARLSQGFSAGKGNTTVAGSGSFMSSGNSLSRPTKTVDNNNMYALPVSLYFAPPFQSQHTNDRVMTMTNSDGGSLRASKSVPDIMNELESELNKQPVYQISQRHSCITPPPSELSKEKMETEKWRPWPNLDSPDNPPQMLSDSIPASSTSRLASKSDIQNTRTPSTLPNPFSELPPSAQRLVQHISEMGFALPRVSRACQMFGEDDKKIVEFLLQVQSLEEKNYPGDLAEQSLISNNYNEDESINYMKLVAQLMDLGFSEIQVIQALKMNENDGERALDYLVS